jgi:spermidine/putrescine transport system permease protein
MVGNKIAQRTFVDRNLPHAAGLSAILAVAVLAPLLAIASLRRRESPRDALREEGV